MSYNNYISDYQLVTMAHLSMINGQLFSNSYYRIPEEANINMSEIGTNVH